MLTSPTAMWGLFFIYLYEEVFMHPPHLYQLKHFLILFFPLLLTQIAQVGTPVFASIFSGQYSTIDLAGVAVGSNIWYPIFAGMCGIFFGISPILSQLEEQRKRIESRHTSNKALYYLAIDGFHLHTGLFLRRFFLGNNAIGCTSPYHCS